MRALLQRRQRVRCSVTVTCSGTRDTSRGYGKVFTTTMNTMNHIVNGNLPVYMN